MNVHDNDFQDFVIHQMTLGDLEFWLKAYTIINSNPIKAGGSYDPPPPPITKPVMTPEAIKKRVQQWPQEQ